MEHNSQFDYPKKNSRGRFTDDDRYQEGRNAIRHGNENYDDIRYNQNDFDFDDDHGNGPKARYKGDEHYNQYDQYDRNPRDNDDEEDEYLYGDSHRQGMGRHAPHNGGRTRSSR